MSLYLGLSVLVTNPDRSRSLVDSRARKEWLQTLSSVMWLVGRELCPMREKFDPGVAGDDPWLSLSSLHSLELNEHHPEGPVHHSDHGACVRSML